MDNDWLVTQFEAARPRLRAVAHRMLGSRAEAEDAVQEAWLRLSGADAGRIDNLGGWLTTVTARVCLDRLRARSRADEPLDDDVMPVALDHDPAEQALVAEGAQAARRAIVDGLAALVWAPGGQNRGVIQFAVADDRIAAIDVTGDDERIADLEIVLLDQ